MEIMKKILDFLVKWFLVLQALVAVLSIAIFQALSEPKLQNELIVALLSLIAFDFFVLALSYLESIKKGNNELNKKMDEMGANFNIVERTKFDWVSAIQSAHNDVFINGTTLTGYVGKKHEFLKISPKIDVRMLVLNLEDEAVLDGFRRMRYMDNQTHTNQRYINQGNLFKDLYNTLSPHDNFSFGVSDRITPISYFAVDIQRISKNSFIRVQHYLHEKESDDSCITYIIRPGHPFFDIYKEQIEILWQNSIKENTYLEH